MAEIDRLFAGIVLFQTFYSPVYKCAVPVKGDLIACNVRLFLRCTECCIRPVPAQIRRCLQHHRVKGNFNRVILCTAVRASRSQDSRSLRAISGAFPYKSNRADTAFQLYVALQKRTPVQQGKDRLLLTLIEKCLTHFGRESIRPRLTLECNAIHLEGTQGLHSSDCAVYLEFRHISSVLLIGKPEITVVTVIDKILRRYLIPVQSIGNAGKRLREIRPATPVIGALHPDSVQALHIFRIILSSRPGIEAELCGKHTGAIAQVNIIITGAVHQIPEGIIFPVKKQVSDLILCQIAVGVMPLIMRRNHCRRLFADFHFLGIICSVHQYSVRTALRRHTVAVPRHLQRHIHQYMGCRSRNVSPAGLDNIFIRRFYYCNTKSLRYLRHDQRRRTLGRNGYSGDQTAKPLNHYRDCRRVSSCAVRRRHRKR